MFALAAARISIVEMLRLVLTAMVLPLRSARVWIGLSLATMMVCVPLALWKPSETIFRSMTPLASALKKET